MLYPFEYFPSSYDELGIVLRVEATRMKRDSNRGLVGVGFAIWSERLTCNPMMLIESDQNRKSYLRTCF